VQRVSGKPLPIRSREPLFAARHAKSTFVQPLPENLKPLMSNGYKKGSGKAEGPFEFVEAYPAGSVSTTAKDMSTS